ncbi:MAG: YHYH protein [Bacteroidetes bacterium]|nr:YHYH protein [Bacteroidota bacterium]
MKFLATFLLFATVSAAAYAQRTGPEVTSWILNLTGKTGYHGISSNVQQVRYSTDNVYVSCTCIPGYDIGPWAGNPNTPMNQNFVFKITRHPAQNTGTATATPLGHIGVWTNGVSIFNAKDAHSYNNQNVWNQNAIIVEGSSFDACLGHPAPNGEYHHHLNPRCLYDDQDSSHHSPIIGFAFDGYPIYGAYGYRNADGSGGVTRMRSSYRLRSLTQRNSLPDGGTLQQSQYGPDVSPQYPLGFYIEDFEFVQSIGDLDVHNGRFCVTPEYPNGTYAYFVTLDVDGNAAYPYILGPTYYGVVPQGNTGPQSGHNTPAEPVTTYTGTSDVEAPADARNLNIYPNPATDIATVQAPSTDGDWRISISDLLGHNVASMGTIAGGTVRTFSVAGLVSGVYLMHLESGAQTRTTRLVIAR